MKLQNMVHSDLQRDSSADYCWLAYICHRHRILLTLLAPGCDLSYPGPDSMYQGLESVHMGYDNPLSTDLGNLILDFRHYKDQDTAADSAVHRMGFSANNHLRANFPVLTEVVGYQVDRNALTVHFDTTNLAAQLIVL